MSGLIYEVDGFHRAQGAVFAPIGAATGAVILPTGWDGAVAWLALPVLALGAGIAFYSGCWQPHRVTLDDAGVQLEAVARRVHIAWDDLESVAPGRWDVYRDMLLWQRRGGRMVRTLSAFPDLHRMLTEVERQAPHAVVSS